MPTQRQSLNLISARMVHHMLQSNGLKGRTTMVSDAITDALLASPSESPTKRDVAICVGGGGDPLSEFDAARVLCESCEKSYATLVCNDMIALFPHHIDFAVTLHPDKMHTWVGLRMKYGHPMPFGSSWAHRSYRGFTNNTKDWQGSSGLFMTKIAREHGYTHIILAGIPMTVEAEHFVRHERWNAAPGFMRGWKREQHGLAPYVRSMSGWTQETFGLPSVAWLCEAIEDKHPRRPQPTATVAPPLRSFPRPGIKA